MRGKRLVETAERIITRIIPAHAGQTLPRGPRIRPWSDHPRACGANWVLGQHVNVAPGSSPRMRGKPMTRCSRCSGIRIIPAHAGQTSAAPFPSIRPADHPRACGANARTTVIYEVIAGSSPRMRGKPMQLTAQEYDGRIIPAHAGQTARHARIDGVRTDHPRACGANSNVGFIPAIVFGSSPRMRGKLIDCRVRSRRRRIIPAHAGQTPQFGNSVWIETDHPRACGANFPIAALFCVLFGSSPRMRGKHGKQRCQRSQLRIIPAHAGQTAEMTDDDYNGTDHPRACGANAVMWSISHAICGSSPRMRGKPVFLLW